MSKKLDDIIRRIGELQGVTGLPTPKIQRVIDSGEIDLMTATPAEVYKAVTGLNLPGPAKEYVPPAKPGMVASEPVTLEERVARDPGIAQSIADNQDLIPPELMERVRAGDPEAIMEAYRLPGEPRRPVRQMELPLPEDPGTALIPYGVRGPGAPGSLSGPGQMQSPGMSLIPAPLRGIQGPGQRRIGTTAGVPGQLSGPGVMQGDPDWNRFVDEWDNTRPFENSAANDLRMRTGERGLTTEVNLPRLPGRVIDAPSTGTRNPRRRVTETPDEVGIGSVVGTGLALTAVNRLLKDYDTEEALSNTSGTEDLVEESRPAPRVAAAPDYSYEARQLMNKLNAMRREAGGEVPESKAMMAEINRLLGMANSQRNAPGYQPAMPTDYHGEAQRLIQDLNARRQKAGREVPDAPQVMARVRQLQAQGDRMRNAG